MKRNTISKSIPTIPQANYILEMNTRLRQLASRVASLEAEHEEVFAGTAASSGAGRWPGHEAQEHQRLGRTARHDWHVVEESEGASSEYYSAGFFRRSNRASAAGASPLTVSLVQPLRIRTASRWPNEARRIVEHAEGQIRRGEGMAAAGMLRDAARLCDLLEHRSVHYRKRSGKQTSRAGRWLGHEAPDPGRGEAFG